MSDTQRKSGFGQLLTELRRRHVVRFALGYAAAAFVILQLAEIVFPAFGIGEGGLRLLVVAAGLAFPPSMVLAWMYDLTTEGLQRTEQGAAVSPFLPRLALGALLVATVGMTGALGLFLARQGVFESTDRGPDRRVTPVTLASYDASEPISSIAVLPLEDFSPDGEQAYFAAGLHEELITKLSQLHDIRVVSRTSAMRYADTRLTMPEIGEELDVDVVVEGSVTRTPERTRVTLRLIHAASESEIQTLQFDREELADMLSFQTEVAHAVVEAVDTDHAETTFTQAAADLSPTAQDAYLQGRYEYERGTQEGYQMAFEYFEEALAEEPEFAQAMAGMASARFLIGLDEPVASEEEISRAHQEARSALAMDSSSVEAREVLTFIERSMPRIFTEDPMIPAPGSEPKQITVTSMVSGVDSLVIDVSAFDTAWVAAQTSLGERIEEQVRMRALSGERNASSRVAMEARRFMSDGRYTEAARLLEGLVDDTPEYAPAWEMLAHAHVASGEPHDAAEVIQAWHDSGAQGAPDDLQARGLYEDVTRDGVRGFWQWNIERWDALEAQSGRPMPRMNYATAHAAMGDTEEALRYLGQALEAGEPGVLQIRSDPVWDEVRKDPRFREIGRQVQEMRFSSGRRPRAPGR